MEAGSNEYDPEYDEESAFDNDDDGYELIKMGKH